MTRDIQVVAYEGEQLWQRVHDDVVISLLTETFEGIKIRRRLKRDVEKSMANKVSAWGNEFRPGERCDSATCNLVVYQNDYVAAGGKQFCRCVCSASPPTHTHTARTSSLRHFFPFPRLQRMVAFVRPMASCSRCHHPATTIMVPSESSPTSRGVVAQDMLSVRHVQPCAEAVRLLRLSRHAASVPQMPPRI